MELYRFGQVERALWVLNDVEPHSANQFRSRVRNLRRAGLETGISRGAGRKPTMTIVHAATVTVAVELGQIGIGPERTVEIVNANTSVLRAATAAALNPGAAAIMIHGRPAEWTSGTVLDWSTVEAFVQSLRAGELGRVFAIDWTRVLRGLLAELDRHGEARAELVRWAKEA